MFVQTRVPILLMISWLMIKLSTVRDVVTRNMHTYATVLILATFLPLCEKRTGLHGLKDVDVDRVYERRHQYATIC